MSFNFQFSNFTNDFVSQPPANYWQNNYSSSSGSYSQQYVGQHMANQHTGNGSGSTSGYPQATNGNTLVGHCRMGPMAPPGPFR